MPTPFVVKPGKAPRPLEVVGEKITVLASGNQTEGYEIFLQQGAAGSGPPPHSHDWDESFYVLKGEVEFGFDAEKMLAEPGTLVHLPAGTTHWFRFGTGGGEMISMTSRKAASEMFTAFDREISPDAPDVEKLARIGARFGAKIGAPPA